MLFGKKYLEKGIVFLNNFLTEMQGCYHGKSKNY